MTAVARKGAGQYAFYRGNRPRRGHADAGPGQAQAEPGRRREARRVAVARQQPQDAELDQPEPAARPAPEPLQGDAPGRQPVLSPSFRAVAVQVIPRSIPRGVTVLRTPCSRRMLRGEPSPPPDSNSKGKERQFPVAVSKTLTHPADAVEWISREIRLPGCLLLVSPGRRNAQAEDPPVGPSSSRVNNSTLVLPPSETSIVAAEPAHVRLHPAGRGRIDLESNRTVPTPSGFWMTGDSRPAGTTVSGSAGGRAGRWPSRRGRCRSRRRHR